MDEKRMFDLTEDDMEYLADSSGIIARGRSYYRNGHVKSIDVNDYRAVARVKGSKLYRVEISIDDDEIDADCNCPYGGPGCKHIVAVMLNIINFHSPSARTKSSVIEHNFSKNSFKKHTGNNTAVNLLNNKKNFPEINIAHIESVFSKELIFEAINFIRYGRIDIKSYSKNVLVAHVKDIDGTSEDHNVKIFFFYNSYKNFHCECTCRHHLHLECNHSAAVMLKFKSEHDKSFNIETYAFKVQEELNTRKLSQLFDDLKYIPNNENSSDYETKRHSFVFEIKRRANKSLTIELKRNYVLKSGFNSKLTTVSENFIKEYKFELSENLKHAISLMIASLSQSKERHYSNYQPLVKTEFESYLDLEFLKALKSLYKESNACIIGAIFIDDIASIEASIEDNNHDNNHTLKFRIKTTDKIFLLDDYLLLGKKNLWIAISENGKINFIELACKKADIVKKLVSYYGLRIDHKRLERIVKNHYVGFSDVMNLQLPQKYALEEKNFDPKPRILLSDYDNMFKIELRFKYDKYEVGYNDFNDIVVNTMKTDNNKTQIVKIKRDKIKEKEYFTFLLDNHILEKDSILMPAIDPYSWLVDISGNLAAHGFEIYGSDRLFNQRINSNNIELNMVVSSGIDWFDIKAEAKIGNENIEFNKILDSFKKNERFIKLSDGSIGVIPKKWLEKFSGVVGFLNYDNKNNTLKASKHHIGVVDSLISVAKKSKTDKEFNKIKARFKKFKEIQKVALPKKMSTPLREYQKYGYDWLCFLKEFSFGGCLADEMGLGKTAQVLALLLKEKELGNITPSLIVVPRSLVFNWVNEIKKFTPTLTVYINHGLERITRTDMNSKNDKSMLNSFDLIITTYGTLRNDAESFKNKKFHYIVLDESQNIKNPLSKISRNIYELQSNYRVAITGTPIENNSLELWSQFAFLNPGLLGNMDYFKNTFAKSIEKDKDKDKTSALRDMINPFILIRKKEAVAKDLPKKQVITRYCEMSDEQEKVYVYWKERFRNEIQQTIQEGGFGQSKLKILQGLTKLRQICNHPILIDESYCADSGKYDLILEEMEQVINSGHKILIFSSFVKMLNVFRRHFMSKNIQYSYLDGSTKNREEVVEQFQENDLVKIFLISIKAGGLGLNLTAADYVFIVDPWWNPAAELQAMDRTHRIGQTKNVFIYKFITKNTVEEKILELQESKLELVKNVISIEEGVFKKLQEEDILKIFK